ncbi:2Fe-2S iron-sulfur cluster-binding protein [Natrinema sp. LN54]|uniref:2Fe-2S iron-sulfur cluster-binding protein n=1 Tax=Natrinema sp. LN54 TaxID=3458705 RepID=UPI004037226D
MTDYDVTLEWADGRTESVVVAEDETVLEAAQRDRIRLPYDCRTGTCITCVGRLVALEDGDGDLKENEPNEPIDAAEGFTYRRSPQALTEQEGADGYVLLCIASPRADCRIEVGPRVRAEVGDSPWA